MDNGEKMYSLSVARVTGHCFLMMVSSQLFYEDKYLLTAIITVPHLSSLPFRQETCWGTFPFRLLWHGAFQEKLVSRKTNLR